MFLRIAPFAVLTAAASLVVVAQSDKVSTELTRLATAVPAVVPEDSRAAIVSRLDRGRTAHATGQMYLALYDLQVVYEAEGGYRVSAMQKETPDHAAFTRKWTEMGAPPDPPKSRARVLFVEALAQSAEGRAPATYRASLPYAQDAGIPAGLYYLGESHAMTRFAALCRSLDLQPRGRPLAVGPVESALAAHEKEVVKAYDAAPAAQRPQYAGVNVAIKQSRTLDEQRRHEGALLQYLVSRHRYRMIQAAAGPPAPRADELKKRIAATTFPAGVDHSIGEFFLQLASATATAPDPAPRAAVAILDHIIPAYLAVVNK